MLDPDGCREPVGEFCQIIRPAINVAVLTARNVTKESSSAPGSVQNPVGGFGRTYQVDVRRIPGRFQQPLHSHVHMGFPCPAGLTSIMYDGGNRCRAGVCTYLTVYV